MGKEKIFDLLYKTKERYKITITFFLLIIFFGFLFVFLPLNTLGIDVGSNKAWDVLIKLVSSSVLSLLVRKPLFATDPLATGKGKSSLFFRKLYPSNCILERYEVSEGEAKDLWFDFFNSWGDDNSRYNSQWKTTFDRTYSCRFIYYLKGVLFIFSIVSGLLLLFFYIYNKIQPDTFLIDIKNIGYFLIITVSFLFLHLTNRISTKGGMEPSGCWYKYQEISSITHSILKREVLDKAESFEKAREIVDKIHKD